MTQRIGNRIPTSQALGQCSESRSVRSKYRLFPPRSRSVASVKWVRSVMCWSCNSCHLWQNYKRSMPICITKSKLSSCFWAGLKHALARANAAVHITAVCILLFCRGTSHPQGLIGVLNLKNFKEILGFCGSSGVPAWKVCARDKLSQSGYNL